MSRGELMFEDDKVWTCPMCQGLFFSVCEQDEPRGAHVRGQGVEVPYVPGRADLFSLIRMSRGELVFEDNKVWRCLMCLGKLICFL